MSEFLRKKEGESIGEQAQKDYDDTVERSLADFPRILKKMSERSPHSPIDWFTDIPAEPWIEIKFYVAAPAFEVSTGDEVYFLYQPATGTTYRVGVDGVLHPMTPPFKLSLWRRFVNWWRL